MEISDLSPDGEGEDGKTATVERKIPVKDEFDTAIPKHELLDSTASKSKKDLASRGALANRQLPSSKKLGSSNSSSNGTLDESEEEQNIDVANNNPSFANGVHYSTPLVNKPVVSPPFRFTLRSTRKRRGTTRLRPFKLLILRLTRPFRTSFATTSGARSPAQATEAT